MKRKISWRALHDDCRGLEGIEYLLIGALVIIAAIGAWRFLGKTIQTDVQQVAATVDQTTTDSIRNGLASDVGTMSGTGRMIDSSPSIGGIGNDDKSQVGSLGPLSSNSATDSKPQIASLSTKEQLSSYINDLEKKLDTQANTQVANLDLQNALQKQQQLIQTMSTVSKTLHTTALDIIRTLGW